MECGIYAIYDDKTLVYIGQSCDIKKRERFHLWQLRKGRHPNSYLQRIYNKRLSLEFRTLESVETREELTPREIHYINTLKPLCNSTIPGEDDTWIFSQERNTKVSVGNKGKPKSAEHRKNISLAKLGEKNPMYGKPAWNRGISRYGKDNPFFGKRHTEEYKKRMSLLKQTPLDLKDVLSMKASGVKISDIAKKHNVSVKTIYRRIKQTNVQDNNTRSNT